ncbi:MAG: GntR family transcriptional regulator [Ruminococcus sp.]|nr:GntR family transcriptional regulator [Ruminococcus sp.]MCM1382439.1 GntR family transcriptional regulator [Muribaculaceae bacterium]
MIFYAVECFGREDILAKRRKMPLFGTPGGGKITEEIFNAIKERVNFMYNIDLQSRTPIYEQLYKKVGELILKGELKPNDKLPSVRELAKELGVNPNTVSKAFQLLERDKVIYSLAGRGSFVSNIGTDAVKENALADFDRAVSEALNAGITKKELLERIGADKA